MLIVKHNNDYYVGKFEIKGVVIMINHSSEKQDARRFKNMQELEEEMKNVENYDYEIEEVK